MLRFFGSLNIVFIIFITILINVSPQKLIIVNIKYSYVFETGSLKLYRISVTVKTRITITGIICNKLYNTAVYFVFFIILLHFLS